MNEIPQHWEDIIKSKPAAIDDGSFYYTTPEPLGKSGYSFRYVIEEVSDAHNLPAGIYVETTIPEEDLEADATNLALLVGNIVCLQLAAAQSRKTIPMGDGRLLDIGNSTNLVDEGFRTENGRVVFHLLPVTPDSAETTMRAVLDRKQVGYIMPKP